MCHNQVAQEPPIKEGNELRVENSQPLKVRTRARKRKLLFKKHMLYVGADPVLQRNEQLEAESYPIRDVTPAELATLALDENVFIIIVKTP